MVAPNLIENPGGTATPGSSVVPATVVVANSRADYPLTEAGINSAIADINAAGGGTIYLGQDDGVPVAIAANLTAITAPCKIVGAGRRALTLVPAAGVSLFSVGAVAFSISDLSVTGDENTAQKFIVATAGLSDQTQRITVERVTIGNSIGVNVGRIKTVFDCASFARVYVVNDCVFNVRSSSDSAGSRLILDGASATFFMNDVQSFFGSAINACGTLNAKNCSFATASSGITISSAVLVNSSIIASGLTVTLGVSTIRVISSSIVATTLTITGIAQIESSSISVTTLNANTDNIKIGKCTFIGTFSTSGFNGHVLRDNFMINVGGPNVLLDDSTGCVVEGNTDCEIQESGTSDGNIISNNFGTSASVIIGGSDTVDGSRRFGGTGDTTDAYVELFTFTSFKGLIGIGTIKNTDGAADQLTVEEEVVDAFGATTTIETVVDAGNDYMLDLQTNFDTTGFPPYLSYRVRVKSTSAGNPAPYSIQFAAQGVTP